MIQDALNQIMVNESISPTKLAAKLNISSAMLSYVLNGKRQPGAKMLRGLWKHYRKLCKEYLEGN
jgi:transcriptional regulator with XRE-family HTH domain